MCRLVGISANQPTNIELSLQEFSEHSLGNPDGYGFAYWMNGGLTIEKQATRLLRDEATKALATARSQIFLGHVRLQSVGKRSHENTHPFVATIGTKEYAFAHNGTVSAVRSWRIENPCAGTTDSEHALHWLRDRLHDCAPEMFSQELRRHAAEIAQLGRFNFLLSDGVHLWAHAHDSLWVLERNNNHNRTVRLLRAHQSVWLADHKTQNESAVIVASEPLTDEDWRRLPAGTLLTIRDGRIVGELNADGVEQVQPYRQQSRYNNFQDLAENEPREAWTTRSIWCESPVTVVALHGGTIQPGTEAVAEAIAGDDYNLWWFAGLREPGAELHINSAKFFHPELDEFAGHSDFVLSINGFDDHRKIVRLSGGNRALLHRLADRFSKLGILVEIDESAGRSVNNVVNRSRFYGAQINISSALRQSFFNWGSQTADLRRFVAGVLGALNDLQLSQLA